MNNEIISICNLDTLETGSYHVLKQGDTYALFIKEDGTFEFVVDHNSKVSFIVNEGKNVSIICTLRNEMKEVEIDFVVEKDATCRAFIDNMQALCVKENHVVKERAKLYIGYGDLMRKKNAHHVHYDLKGNDALLESKMAYICDGEDDKRLDVHVEHEKGITSSDVELYGVMKHDGRFVADITGHIVNGAKASSCRQASRVLNFDANVKAKVSPILLIDENDVQASHACSIGTVDENHLYYLQSRGLSRRDAVALIVSGYLAVLKTVFDDEILIEKVEKNILERAGE